MKQAIYKLTQQLSDWMERFSNSQFEVMCRGGTGGHMPDEPYNEARDQEALIY